MDEFKASGTQLQLIYKGLLALIERKEGAGIDPSLGFDPRGWDTTLGAQGRRGSSHASSSDADNDELFIMLHHLTRLLRGANEFKWFRKDLFHEGSENHWQDYCELLVKYYDCPAWIPVNFQEGEFGRLCTLAESQGREMRDVVAEAIREYLRDS